MPPMIGQGIVIAGICVITFFAARATLRNIKAELRGEATCAGCNGCNGCGGNKAECKMCGKSVDELRKLAREKSKSF